MAMKINPINLDFDTLKSSLKTYLKSQTTFKDYNFEGSGLSVLLDVLAANTQYNAFMANMLANESFLDSALVRSNVVSLAKMLNYVPSSRKAPVATIRLTVSGVTNSPASITLDRDYRFTATLDGTTYSFIPASSRTILKNNSNQYVADVNIYQGTITSFSYIMNVNDTNPKFVIPSEKVDLSFLKVYVYTDGTTNNAPEEYKFADDISQLTKVSRSYFIQENEDGYYEVYFGDNVISYQPLNGSLIVLEYLLTEGDAANNVSVFSKSVDIAGSNGISITTLSNAAGGSLKESIDSIKLLAPKFNATQNRAVTVNDFKTIIKKNYPSIQSVAVWGGEDMEPVSYGRIYISLRPYNNYTFSDIFKNNLIDDLKKNYMVASITPVIQDPDYLYIIVNSSIEYDLDTLKVSETELETNILNSIENYFNNSVNDFNTSLKYSKLVSAIDETDTSIVGNYTKFKLKKIFYPLLGTTAEYILNFSNAIEPETLTSDAFVIQGTTYYLKDVPVGSYPYSTGNIVVYKVINNTDVQYATIGTINYSTGKVILSKFYADSITNSNGLNVYVSLATSNIDVNTSSITYDVYTNSRNQMIIFDSTNSSINIVGV